MKLDGILTIYDMNSRLMDRKIVNGNSKCSAGIYLLNLSPDNKDETVKRTVILVK